MRAATAFTLAPELSAVAPPEARGLARDEVRLLVARNRRPLRHRRFRDLPGALRPGDLVVVNTSDTEPAAVDGRRLDGRAVVLHVSGPVFGGLRSEAVADEVVVELRTPDGRRIDDAAVGERLRFAGGRTATLLAGYPDAAVGIGSRLWRARLPPAGYRWLRTVGRPIHYSYLRGRWPLAAYRTVFAELAAADAGAEFADAEFASAEMPSAARPFTRAVLDGLRVRGVDVAALTLHTGVSSLEADEVPLPERYRVPAATAAAVNATRDAGGRVIAVGTTVTRALETVADAAGRVSAGAGWTDLVLGPDHPARVVRGLVTGWHEPQASHLLLLEAVAGPQLVGRTYAAALDHGYRWHEFGDSCLLLP